MNWMLFIIIVALVALCFVGLGVQTFFGKRRKFPETEIERNAVLRRRGIVCAKTEEMRLHGRRRQKKVRCDGECEGCAFAGNSDKNGKRE